MKNLYFLFFIFFIFLKSFGNGGYITISSGVPSNITICGQAKTFSFTINNPSAFNLTGVTVSLTMPTGIDYQIGSVTNATAISTASLNAPTFSLANIPSLSSIVITYTASANCNVLSYLSLGLPIENTLKVNYTAGANTTFDTHTSSGYSIKQPNLSITNVTNQSYNGSIGGTFTRCITITNGGSGELSAFTLTDLHGTGLQITAATPGAWTSAAGTETYVLSGINFTSIGNNNNLFENGESITICETVLINNCSSVNTSYNASWGCNGQSCQSSNSSANVVFPNFVPNLVVTSQPTANVCLGYGNPNIQQLTITNTGAGQAINTILNIYNINSSNNFVVNNKSEIDITSFTIKINGGAATPISVASATANTTYSCLSSSPVAGVKLNLPTINSGDVILLNWNTKNCCETEVINGWGYKADYQSICLNNYFIPQTVAYNYKLLRITSIFNNGSPSSLVSGQTATFNYLTTGYTFNYQSPSSNNPYWKVTFTVSPCFTYSNNTIKVVNASNTSTWYPGSVSQIGNVITATFNGPSLFTWAQAQVLIDLTANCNSCVSGSDQVSIGIYYSPSTSCACEMFVISNSFPVNIVCPVSCEGLNFLNYSVNRTTYGLPDNNDDGLADAIGVLDFTKIKTSRAMYGDIVTTSFFGKVKTSVTNPNWQYCYANSTFTNGNNLTSLGGQLKIYRNNALYATCNIAGVAAVAPTATFKYNLSTSALVASGGVSNGFVYMNDDSLVFEPQYKVTTNIAGAVLPVAITNTFMTSDIANPTNSSNIFSCNTFEGNFTIIGYFYHNYGSNSYSLTACNQVVINQNYYLSIGPCCNNYAGGNLFPFEYRNWANIDTLKATLPNGYKLVAASFYENRTMGSNNSSTSPVFPIIPFNPLASTLVFNVGSYFTGATPSIVPSDDGFYGTLTMTIEPSCAVISNTPQNVKYSWVFKASSYLPQNLASITKNASISDEDILSYTGPSIFLQSTLPNINAVNNVVVWDISLSNISNSTANNAWLSATQISGVSIGTVVNVSTNTTLTPVGGIYQLGVFAGATLQNFKLYGTYTSCAKDSIIIEAGWNCQGYPAMVSAYPCVSQKLKLTATPLAPLLVTTVITPSTTVNLCDFAEYEVIGTNVQLGTAYSLSVNVNIPPGVTIVSGTSEMAYPASSAYVITSNPVWIGGTTYQYNISVLSPSIGANGLPGILNSANNSVKIRFKVVTSCGYTSGSLASFSFFGVSGCGASTGQLVSLSSQLGIIGASAPYLTNTVLKSTFISPCNNSSILRVSSQNLGGLSFGNTDSVRVILPVGVSYIPGSFIGIHNPPVNPVPAITVFNNQQNLVWKLPPGVTPNDSTVFTIGYVGNPSILKCNISNFEAKTTSSSALLCTSSGSFCGVQVITGGDTLPIFTYKSYLSLANASGYSVPNPPSGETAYMTFTINNTGQALNSSYNTVINYYNDVNANGIYNAGDVLITQHTVNIAIPVNGTYVYSYTLNIPPGAGCHLVALLDTALNHCSCSPSQIGFNLPLRNMALNATICSGNTATLGLNSITGYIYSWSPGTNLNSTSSSSPIATGVNTTTLTNTVNYIVTVNRIGCTSLDTAIVIVNPLPTLNLINYTICNGSSTTASVSGANSYTWFPANSLSSSTGNTVTASPINTTTYTVTGKDLNGCSSSSVSTVLVNNLPTLSIANYTICNGSSAAASVSGANTYTWMPPSLTATIGASVALSPTITTAYTVTGADANSCSSTSVSSVFVNNLPILSIPNYTICSGSSTTASVSGANSYTWFPANTLSSSTGNTVTAIPINTTTYTVTGMDANSCVNTHTTNVLVNPLPNVSATTNTICALQSATIAASGASTYTWSPSSTLSSSITTTVTANPTITTVYTVTGTDLNGCINTYTTNFVVNQLPNVNATSNAICIFQSGTLAASGAVNYTWSPSTTLNSNSSPTVTANPTVTTVYTLTGEDANGCLQTNTTTILVNPLPNVSATNNTICVLQSGTLIASGAVNYTWSPANTLNSNSNPTVTANPLITTVYTITGEDARGCIKTNTTNVVVNPLPNVSATSNTICALQSGTLSVNGAVNYTWSPANTLNSNANPTVTANPIITTVYTITGQDANGCVQSNTTNVIVNPLPNVSVTSNTICALQSGTLSANGAVNYTWSPSSTLSSSTTTIVTANPTITTIYTVIGEDVNGCIQTNTSTVIVNQLPNVSATSNTICVLQNGTLSANGAVNYTWSPANTLNSNTNPTVTANPIITTVYTITGQDINGCVQSNTTNVIVNPLPNVSATSNTICALQSGTISANGALNYTWSPAATLNSNANPTVTANPLVTTVYTITGQDINGCVKSNTTSIVVNPLPNVNVTSNTICILQSGILSANGAINYTWSPAATLSSSVTTTVTANPTVTTVYTVTGTDGNNCSNSATTTVIVNTLPNITVTSNTICNGVNAPLVASGATSYTWTSSILSSSVISPTVITSPSVTTTYTVSGTNAEGCISTKTTVLVVKPLPVLSISNHTICYGNSANVIVSGADSYSWVPAGNLSSSTGSNVIANPLVTVSYNVIGLGLNGCSSTSVTSIIVNPLPVISITSPSSVMCKGQTANLYASGGVTYTWNTVSNSTVQTVSPSNATIYTLIGKDVNGCLNTDTFLLNVLIQPTLTISGSPTLCIGDRVKLTVSGGNNYTWNDGNTSDILIVNPTVNTNYTVSAGVAPCASSIMYAVTVFTPQPIASFAQPPSIIYGFSTTLIADTIGGENVWLNSPDIQCSPCNSVVVSPKETTIYAVNVTDNQGCIVTNTILVQVDIICGDAFVPSAFSPNNDGFNDYWCVYGNCIKTMNVQVFNRWGEKVFESEDKNKCWDGGYVGDMQGDAVFMYQLTATFINGENIVKKGNVTLVR